MAYVSRRTGQKRYSNKDLMKYHTNCANKGYCKGKKLTETQKVRHAILAEKYRKKINRYHNAAARFGFDY